MAEAVVSLVVERLASVIEEQIREEINLVVGVKKEVKSLTKKLKMIRTILEDAEKRKMKEIDVQGWLEEFHGLSYDMDDVLDEWNTALLKAELEQVDHSSVSRPKLSFSSISSCFCLKKVSLRRDIALKIKDLNTRLEVIYKEKDQFKFVEGERIDSNVFKPIKTTSVVKESEVYGRDDDKDVLVTKLLDEVSIDSQEQDEILVMSIVGTGGLGKTTLAQLVYNDESVGKEFELKIWVCVSDPFDEIRVAKAILECLGKGKESRDLNELETLLEVVKVEISGKKFLLVLDDVWNEDERLWEPLRNSLENGECGSRVLVTTRNEKVAIMMGSAYLHRLGLLSDVDCWSLFKKIAFVGRKKDEGRLEGIGKEIVKKCHGMPLATKTLAGLLRFKNTTEEWQNVLDSELWKLEVAAIKLFPHLYLSFCDVPSIMRPCFTYCAIFPKDTKIVVADLIKLWMAQGYLATARSDEEVELRGQEYFNDLAMRSLFQDFERDEFGEEVISCKMHDIVHDFAQYMAGKECLIMQNDSGSNSSDSVQVRHFNWIASEEFTCIPSVCTTGKLRSFLADSVPENLFQDLLSNLKHVRSLRLKNADLYEIPKDISTLIHLRYLNLSDNPLEELPEEVCDLINLETLDISESGIYALPLAIGKLINLRHLVITECYLQFPQSLETLTSLRTFDKFILKRGNKLGCLKNFNNLRGSLEITVDDDVDLVSEKIEMEKAELKCKKHIKKFQLMFYDQVYPDHFGDPSVLTELIDVLGSPPNVEVLYLYALPTTRLPTWITSLYSLRDLTLESGELWSSLPPLGRLPHLESLQICNFPSCRHIGHNFLGVEVEGRDTTDATSSGESSSASSVVVAFPKLEKLVIRDCEEFEEWEDLTDKDEKRFAVFPRLQNLEILFCRRLKTLPPRLLGMATSLESLQIKNCHTFLDHHVKERGLSSHFKEHFMGERRVASSAYFDSNDAIGEFLKRLRCELVTVAPSSNITKGIHLLLM
ncbi:antimicrobial response protein [Lithospermum erythrorhizon]|uniref:Antimicrobial response protein n=1 Tax=Lithospermum erythrorhizon TaxID=34254 RepID=A0AAV3QCG2_LITER